MKSKATGEIRTITLVPAIVLVAAALGASSAFAGEITGNGQGTGMRGHANSECGFSGLDDPDEHTQNWGQIPKDGRDFLTSIGVAPGRALQRASEPAEVTGFATDALDPPGWK